MVVFTIYPVLEVAAVTLPTVAIGAIAFFKVGYGRGYRKGREEERNVEDSIRNGVAKIIQDTAKAINDAASAKEQRKTQAAKRAADVASNGGSQQWPISNR
jgi:hypothetical protein